MAPELTKEEWCERFVARMLKCAGPKFDDGTSIEEYGREVAPSYWEDEDLREEGPDECADEDMSYWGED